MNANMAVVRNMTNREFLEKHARPGLVCLAGGESISCRVIRRAQRHLDVDREWSQWAHAFYFEGIRPDGHHWVVESDLQLNRRHIRLGVQENRLDKYFDGYYSRLALLDFGLTQAQHAVVLRGALDLVAANTRYSLRELAGALLGLRHESLRQRENIFSQSTSFFCSAFVAHLLREAGLEVNPTLPEKHITPEDIFRSLAPHSTILLQRDA